jgi:hypothetical protein
VEPIPRDFAFAAPAARFAAEFVARFKTCLPHAASHNGCAAHAQSLLFTSDIFTLKIQ